MQAIKNFSVGKQYTIIVAIFVMAIPVMQKP